MANAGLNLATRSPAERMDMAADLEACRLLHYREMKGTAWREWAEAELAKLHQQQRVRHFLNARLRLRASE